MLYRRSTRLPANIDFASDSNLVIKIDEIWTEAKSKILKCAACEKSRYDRKDSQMEYRAGDWIRLFASAVKVGLKQKLSNERWMGPFKFLKIEENQNVNIRLESGKEYRVHTDRIKHAARPRGRETTVHAKFNQNLKQAMNTQQIGEQQKIKEPETVELIVKFFLKEFFNQANQRTWTNSNPKTQ